MTKIFLNRLLIIFFILSNTDFLGLVGTKVVFTIPLRDYALLLLIIYWIIYLLRHRGSILRTRGKHLLPSVLYIMLLVTAVIFSMPIRGEANLMGSFLVGRVFYVLMLSLLVYVDVVLSGSVKFIYKLVKFVGLYYCIIVILNVIFPDFVARIFVGGRAIVIENIWGLGATRYAIKSNEGVLFLYLFFIIFFFKYFNGEKDVKKTLTLIIVFLAMVLQGWRAVLISTLFSVFIFSIRKFGMRRICTGIFLLFLIFMAGYAVERATGQRIITNTFISAYLEITGKYEGTLQGRLDRALRYQIPMILRQPFFGYGFVDKDTRYAESLHHMGVHDISKTYTLYNIDFGYGTLLTMFGFIGTLFIVYQLLKIAIRTYNAYKLTNNVFLISTTVLILTLLITNYSLCLLMSRTGLMPLAILIGISEGVLDLQARNKEV